MRQHFPVLYARLSRLLYFVDTPDTYVRFFWEWKTRDHLSTTLAPDTKGREKEKTYIYTRLYTQYTLERTNEPRNPEKRLLSRLCARTTRLYTRHAVFATRGFDYTIPDEIIQNHSLQQQQQHCIVYACTLWHTFTHTLLEIEVRCLIYYTFLAQQKKVWFQRIFSL